MRALASLFAALVLGGCSGDIHRLDTPALSPAASGLIDPALPKSATDIYFFDYAAGLQDLERFVRFRVPTTELDSTVNDLIATNNREAKRSLAYTKTPLNAAPTSSPRSEFLPNDVVDSFTDSHRLLPRRVRWLCT